MDYISAQETIAPQLKPRIDAYAQRNIGNILFSPTQIARQDREVASNLEAFFNQTVSLRYPKTEDLLSICADYRHLFEESPIIQNKFGANYGVGLGVYAITRLLQPSLIVESGVYKGFTSFLMRHAAPNAEIHSYDINLKELAYRTQGVNFHERDWMGHPRIESSATKRFAFFDDHFPQAERILEAYSRGFRLLLLDDSWPFHSLHGDGYPPAPTVDMVLDETLQVGDKASWFCQDRYFEYEHTEEMAALCAQARALVAHAYDFPTLWRSLGWQPSSPLKFVELK